LTGAVIGGGGGAVWHDVNAIARRMIGMANLMLSDIQYFQL